MRHPRRDAEGTLLATSGLCVHKTVNAGTSGSEDEEDIWAGSRQLAMDYGNSTYFFDAEQLGTRHLPTGRFAGYVTNDESGLAHAPARHYLKASRVRVLHLPA